MCHTVSQATFTADHSLGQVILTDSVKLDKRDKAGASHDVSMGITHFRFRLNVGSCGIMRGARAYGLRMVQRHHSLRIRR